MNVAINPKTLSVSQELSNNEILELLNFIDTFCITNKQLAPTVAKFVVKNKKKLTSAYEKANAEMKALVDNWSDKNDKGNIAYWDQSPDGPKVFAVEKNGRITHWIDAAGNKVEGLKVRLHNYIADEKKREEFYASREELSEKKRTVNLVKVNSQLIEGLQIPSVIPGGGYAPDMPSNLELFYDCLVIDEEETEEKVVKEVERNLSVVK